MPLPHLQRLEAESIHIMREVLAETDRPVMLYSIGKDSSVMLHLAKKAFYPAPPPFPLLHVDTTWKFRDMYAMRDRVAAESGMDLIVHVNPEALEKGINPFTHGSAVHTEVWKTQGLKQALDKYGFDAAFGGGRRDEEKSRAKERVLSFRTAQHRRDPKSQRPELWRLYNTRKRKGESIRAFPLSNWTELDVWQYIYLEKIPIVPLYLSRVRPVVERDGALIMVDDDRMQLAPGEKPTMRKVRFRTLGCYPLTGAIESSAETLAEIIAEMRLRLGKSLLRFNTCGSVGDGKSTLIGRLLTESKALHDDQLVALETDSKCVGTRPGELDVALLLDGLSAEREQGNTIDVGYRFFSTARRSFIVADTPGHERYTRNMVTGASTADLSVILVDARRGVLTQTRRHTFLVSLLGIRHVVLAVNKMDLVDHSQAVFARIEEEYRKFAAELGLPAIACIPVSAVNGDNILQRSAATPWYQGTTLMDLLDGVEVDHSRLLEQPLRLPVQWVNRPSADFSGLAGTIVAGRLRKGDAIRVQPAGRLGRVARIVTYDGDLEEAVVGQSITITLDDEIDVSRGELIVPANQPAEVAAQFEATVVWMNEAPLLPGRSYLLKIGTKTVAATISPLKYKINVDNLQHLAAATLELNEIGVGTLQLDRDIPFDPYLVNRDTGGFILIDRTSNDTVAAGMLHFALRRARNVHWQALDVNRAARSAIKGQRSCVLWYTGLSGAGKSTIANLVDKKLHSIKRHTYLLDGDNVRHGLNKDLGFTDADRVENIRRIAEVARLMLDAGLIVSTAFISPFRAERQMARSLLANREFIEIFVDTPLGVAEQRDPKGLYKKARRGDLKNFTGIDSPYEAPENPELRIDTTLTSPEDAAEIIVTYLQERGSFDPD